jgi:hypothetical protein
MNQNNNVAVLHQDEPAGALVPRNKASAAKAC